MINTKELKVHFKKNGLEELEEFNSMRSHINLGHTEDDRYFNAVIVVLIPEEKIIEEDDS